MFQGIQASLKEQIEKTSPTLGRMCIYSKVGRLSTLPRYLIVQYVRFYWRKDTSKKAKILKRVVFPTVFDIQPFCDDNLKSSLGYVRAELQDEKAKKLGLKTTEEMAKETAAKRKKTAKNSDPMEVDVVKTTKVDPTKLMPVDTSGNYTLEGVVTHKGRYADSGHYIGWVRQEGENWHKYDDNVVTTTNEEYIKKLCGGGDRDMAYLLFYKRDDDVKGKYWGKNSTTSTATTTSSSPTTTSS